MWKLKIDLDTSTLAALNPGDIIFNPCTPEKCFDAAAAAELAGRNIYLHRPGASKAATDMMRIGTPAHEIGHVFGLQHRKKWKWCNYEL